MAIAVTGFLGAGLETPVDDGFIAIFPSIAAFVLLAGTLVQGAEDFERTERQVAAVW